ncbi:hypothetical protein BpHYR1_020696 [Brachionus plicatilis]|uniref:Uncharacterized protein n=1 Tax=Brachionus plicatilis TaxID=10195 RepID=A0A3M7PHJ9_BRAPC|nr:hypothetical protein BpHYR1_020696 [Brachionus plicatilis]
MASKRILIFSLVLLLVNGILSSPISSSEESNAAVPKSNDQIDFSSDELAQFLAENENYSGDDSSLMYEDDDSYLMKKSAPRRIFIGKRFLPRFFSDKPNFRSFSPGLNDVFSKRNGIHRIFIGKRGDIKRIFIGK